MCKDNKERIFLNLSHTFIYGDSTTTKKAELFFHASPIYHLKKIFFSRKNPGICCVWKVYIWMRLKCFYVRFSILWALWLAFSKSLSLEIIGTDPNCYFKEKNLVSTIYKGWWYFIFEVNFSMMFKSMYLLYFLFDHYEIVDELDRNLLNN